VEQTVKRTTALLAGVMMSVLVGPLPAAHAKGVGACMISGTISLTPPASASAQGVWRIEPAVIECQGLFEGVDRFIGPGPFSGSGTYTAPAAGSAGCLLQLGRGTVNYLLRTTGTDVRVSEAQEFVLAGAGKFATPSLQGSFIETLPFDGDCVTKPVTRATFVAQAVMPRTSR
jgi:hypothetical protein